jgi:uncharacterized protein involved in type VI secretion and phage assembly
MARNGSSATTRSPAGLPWTPPAGCPPCRLTEVQGEEAADALFEFTLHLHVEKPPADPGAALDPFLGKPVGFGFETGAGPRWFHGYVYTFELSQPLTYYNCWG